ncbi:hypothetical protein ACWDQO_06870 [Streptomyces sp. NPDC003703]|uniref:hypothetical protein n=1 Tax=Streptomyces sp. NPDC003283 TaxID=3364681 RepID=UPI0036C2A573
MAAGLIISLTYSFKGGPISGVAACFFTIALTRRIMGSRIVLGSSALTVVNPLITYTVPYRAVAEVRGGGGETLNLVTQQGDEIYCTGFGGSLIDSFVKSADRAAECIEQQVRRRRRATEKAQVTKKLTVSWIADVCTVGAVVCLITAAFVGV